MFMLATFLLLVDLVASMSWIGPDFCQDMPATEVGPRICFTNWPGVAAVCPNHPYMEKSYGYLTNKIIIENFDLNKCGSPDATGNQICHWKVQAADYSKLGHPPVQYVDLWTIRSINKERYPSYHYGGMSWPQVRSFFL